jgi:aspartyl/asparaginyl beta-hydroxylase (cupin superfamily)
MKNALKLPFHFDADRMKQELESISDSFQLIRNQYTQNSLLGMHLILPNADGVQDENGHSFYMTDELKNCPYLQEVLNTFQCNKFSFRTQNLLPGGKIELHDDGDKGLKHNWIRLNIPVSTNEDVYTYFNHERIPMKNGECWLPDVTKVHEMENKSEETRWLLLLDCDLNDWWKNILKDYGLNFENESKYKYQTVEELENIKQCFLEQGLNEDHFLIQEVDIEITRRN